MSDSKNESRRSVRISLEASGVWFSAWLFTCGFAQLGGWKAFFALLLWPYFLGAKLS